MRDKPISTWNPVPDPLAASGGRAEQLARRLARTAAVIGVLKEQAARLGWRERTECLSLLQTLELRAADAARRLDGLGSEGLASGRKWNRLEQSCLEIEEHLGFLGQTIRNRASHRDRVSGATTPPSRREPS